MAVLSISAAPVSPHRIIEHEHGSRELTPCRSFLLTRAEAEAPVDLQDTYCRFSDTHALQPWPVGSTDVRIQAPGMKIMPQKIVQTLAPVGIVVNFLLSLAISFCHVPGSK
jgi:hypothetical protein